MTDELDPRLDHLRAELADAIPEDPGTDDVGVAAIMAHELTHVMRRHTYMQNRSNRKKFLTMNVIAIVGSVTPGMVGTAISLAAAISPSLRDPATGLFQGSFLNPPITRPFSPFLFGAPIRILQSTAAAPKTAATTRPSGVLPLPRNSSFGSHRFLRQCRRRRSRQRRIRRSLT